MHWLYGIGFLLIGLGVGLANTGRCLFFEEGREPASPLRIAATLASGTTLIVVGLAMVFLFWRTIFSEYRSYDGRVTPAARTLTSGDLPRACITRQAVIDQLGPPLETFKPANENYVAGIVISVLMIAGGSFLLVFQLHKLVANWDTLPWSANNKASLSGFVFGAVLGLLVLAGGFLFLWFVRLCFLEPLTIVVCAKGLVCFHGERGQLFPWESILLIRESRNQEYFPLKGPAKFLLPMGKNRNYVVNRIDGITVEFSRNEIRGSQRLAMLMKVAAKERNIAWHTVEA